MGQFKSDYDYLKTQFESLRKENEGLGKEIASLKDQGFRLSQEKGNAERKTQQLSDLILGKLTEFEKLSETLSFLLKDTRAVISKELDAIELATVEIHPSEASSPSLSSGFSSAPVEASQVSKGEDSLADLEGRVLVVNGELHFIVVNLGISKGFYKGMKIEILREGKKLGLAKIIEVRRNISAADVMESTEALKTGDKVREYKG